MSSIEEASDSDPSIRTPIDILGPVIKQSPSLPEIINELPDHGFEHILSGDFGFTLNTLKLNGFGMGLTYEQQLNNFFSLKMGVNSATYIVEQNNMYCTTLGITTGNQIYPFDKGLEWFYFGSSIGLDFMNYYGSGETPEPNRDVVFSIIPSVGWKQIIFKNIMLDLNAGYKVVVINTANFDNSIEYAGQGLQFGIKVNILWKKLFKNFRKS